MDTQAYLIQREKQLSSSLESLTERIRLYKIKVKDYHKRINMIAYNSIVRQADKCCKKLINIRTQIELNGGG